MRGFLQRASHAVMLAAGWRRAAIAFVAGACGALAMAPVDLFPALAIPMTLAIWLLDGSPAATGGARDRLAPFLDAARDGWWLGFGYFVAGLWWLGAAFLVEADQFAWALPLGVLGLPAGLAIFPAFGFMLARLLWSPGPARILALASGLGLSEWLRGVAFTGFPWNDFGMALGGNLALGQFASLIGLHGLTFLAVALAAAPATLADDRPATQVGGLRRWFATPASLALLALAGLLVFGLVRLSGAPTSYVDGVALRLMQPNLPQDEKFRPQNKDAILDRYLKLSDRATSPRAAGVATVTHLIWPESPFPFILSRDADALARIAGFLPTGVTLITGAARSEPATPAERRAGQNARYTNAIHVIEAGGGIVDTYDKTHLVPFGEYLPLRSLFDALHIRQFVHIPGGFEAGTTRKLMTAKGLRPFLPLICYEAIFSGEVDLRLPGMERPAFMLNVTNDGWFGLTAGPYQHLAQARLRTIEEGLPMVRAANTGVSAIIDPLGRIVERLPLGVEGVLDGRLPKPAAPTVFSRFTLIAPALTALLCLIGALGLRRRRQP